MNFIYEGVNWVYGQLVGYGYTGIFVMMTLESTFVPFPSEVAMIPAGIEVANGQMNLYLAIFFGTFGSWVGSSINYFLAYKYGRDFLKKYGKYVRLDLEKIAMLDRYFKSHGNMTVFIIRFVPLVRQYISFPAGLAKMNFWQFSLYTSLGAGIWVTILAVLGQQFGNVFGEVFLNQQINFELMATVIKPYVNEILIYTGLFLAVLLAIYIFFKKRYLDQPAAQ